MCKESTELTLDVDITKGPCSIVFGNGRPHWRYAREERSRILRKRMKVQSVYSDRAEINDNLYY